MCLFGSKLHSKTYTGENITNNNHLFIHHSTTPLPIPHQSEKSPYNHEASPWPCLRWEAPLYSRFPLSGHVETKGNAEGWALPDARR
jgi:hypothetical protein